MATIQILILKAMLALLLASSPTATLIQKQEAINNGLEAVKQAQVYLAQTKVIDKVVVVEQPKAEFYTPPCVIDSAYNRLACGEKTVNKNPIVFLEGKIIKSNGEVVRIKGINRDSALKEIGIKRDEIPTINLSQVKGFYPTSSISAKDKVEVSVFINNVENFQPNWNCRKTTNAYGWDGKIIGNSTEQFTNDKVYSELAKGLEYTYDYMGNHEKYVQVGIAMACTVITKRWEYSRYVDYKTDYWDSMVVDFVK